MLRLRDYEFDWRGKLWVLGFLGESADEAQALLEEARTLATDPDLVDQEAAAVRMVKLAFQIKRNYLADPAEAFAALPAVANRAAALALLPKSNKKLADLLAWAVDHWDDFAKYVLPLLLLIFGDKLPAVLIPKKAMP